jgi:hypothetical protein
MIAGLFSTISERISRVLERANLSFGMTEAAVLALIGTAIAAAAAYHHVG